MRTIPDEILMPLSIEGIFAIDQMHEVSEELLQHFTVDEQQQLASFTNSKRQREYATSRFSLKKMARQRLGNVAFEVLKDDLGQPYGRSGLDQYYVSIAHSDNHVFCGISEHDGIGVDLEPVDRTVPEKLRRRILHPNEGKQLADVTTIRLWTVKEAFIKLQGKGLRLNMNEVCVDKQEEQFIVQLNNDKTAKICSFQFQNNWLAIAFYQNKTD